MEPTQTPPPAAPKKPNKVVGIVLAVVIVLAAIFITISAKKAPMPPATTDTTTSSDTSTQAPATDDTTNPAQVPPTDTNSQTSSVYKDGTYTAVGSYISPGGPDKIGVTLTLQNDIVTDVTATAMPGDPTSAKYQAKFLSGYKALVVGMNIADIHLTKVSGSSLTPGGFDDALAQIETQAKA